MGDKGGRGSVEGLDKPLGRAHPWGTYVRAFEKLITRVRVFPLVQNYIIFSVGFILRQNNFFPRPFVT